MNFVEKVMGTIEIWTGSTSKYQPEDFIQNKEKEDRLTATSVVEKSTSVEPVCPYCHRRAVLKTSEEFYGTNYGSCLWVCENCKDCYVSTKPGSDYPLGIICDAETRQYRKTLNVLKTQLEKEGWMTKEQFNQKIAGLLGGKKEGSYIGYLNLEQCQYLVSKIDKYLYEKKYRHIFENYENQ